MAAPIKVFIASSGPVKAVADALCNELEDTAKSFNLDVKGQVWHRDVALPGKDILSSLVDHCRGSELDQIQRSDYFVALLTPDDQTEKKGKWTETPRDNCIFELGLFMGGLGFDFRRCFMLCAVEQDSLPSDVEGRTYLGFELPAAPSPATFRDAIKKPAATIISQMLSMKRFNPPGVQSISRADLMALEQPIPKGSLEEEAEVLVNRAQPVEERFEEFAAVVNANMRRGISYRYVFHDVKSMPMIARLVAKIAMAGDGSAPKSGARLSEEQIRKNLEMLKNEMSIHFLPSEAPIEFVIHNAQSTSAVSYLRMPNKDQFVEWCRGTDALNMTRDLLGAQAGSFTPCVFCVTDAFDINAPERKAYKDQFWAAIQTRFPPSLLSDVDKCCFG